MVPRLMRASTSSTTDNTALSTSRRHHSSTAAVLLWARLQGGVPGVVSLLLLVLAIADLGAIVPIWINFRIRLKEIEGGEEDAAAEY